MIGRREFITLLGGAALAWPLAARGQQPGKLPTIGFLGSTTSAAQSQLTAAFVQRLRELGWIEGRTVAIEYRWAEGRSERYAEFAAEFVRLKVDVILVHNTPPLVAAKQATSVIPIVFATAADPVGTGVVASLARPGGNVTGLSSQQTDTTTKRLELLREVVPGLRRLAILANTDNSYAEVAFATLVSAPVDALFVTSDGIFSQQLRELLVTLAARYRLPVLYSHREFVTAGGLICYTSSVFDAGRQAGVYAGRILKGAKPADLPVTQPTKFELVINLTTAKALGVDVPDKLLALADEVIE